MKFTCLHIEHCPEVLRDADSLGVATQQHGCMPWGKTVAPFMFVDGDSRNLLFQLNESFILKWFRPNELLDHIRSYQNDKAALTLLRQHGMDVPEIVACCDRHNFFVMERLSGGSLQDTMKDLDGEKQEQYLQRLCSAHHQANQHLRELRDPPEPDPHLFEQFYRDYILRFLTHDMLKKPHAKFSDVESRIFEGLIAAANKSFAEDSWLFGNLDAEVKNSIVDNGRLYLIDFEKLCWHPLASRIVCMFMILATGGVSPETMNRARRIVREVYEHDIDDKNAEAVEYMLLLPRLGEITLWNKSADEAFAHKFTSTPELQAFEMLIKDCCK